MWYINSQGLMMGLGFLKFFTKKVIFTNGLPIEPTFKKKRNRIKEIKVQFVSPFFELAKENSHYKFIFYSSSPEEEVRKVFPNAGQIAYAPYKRFWSQRVLPKLIAGTKPDIFFSPSSSLPRNFKKMNIPSVVTIHGME